MQFINYFHGISLRKRLTIAFGSILFIIVISSLSIFIAITTTQELVHEKDKLSEQAILIREYQLHIANAWQYATDASLTRDEGVLKQAEIEMKLAFNCSDKILSFDSDEQENKKFAELKITFEEFIVLGHKMFSAYGEGPVFGSYVMEEIDIKGAELLSKIEPLVNVHLDENLVISEEIESHFSTLPIIGFLSIGIIVFSMFFASKKITGYITKSFALITDLFKKVKEGDFSERITNISDTDEFGFVMWELNELIDQFETLLKEVIVSIKYSSAGKYFRKPIPQGLKGMLSDSAIEVADSIDGSEKISASIMNEKEYLAKNVDNLLKAFNIFSRGDLTVSLTPSKGEDAIGKVIKAFNEMVENQKRIILDISNAIEATASASAEISASTEEMAAGAQEQSSQTTEVTTSIEHVTSSIMETTDNTNRAAEEANNSKEIAEKGGVVFSELESGMNNIADVVMQSSEIVNKLGSSGEKIGEIIQVIDDIADQTNLLALNAAIEAARAGEQGRGFAVVADEVRKLAERTTKSTKEIADMIKTIQQETKNAVQSMNKGRTEVESGKDAVKQAGESLSEIIKSSNTVMGIVSEVAMASKEEAEEAEQIQHNISGINAVAQETAIGVEQIAQASEDLSRLTENLQNSISKFILSRDETLSLPSG